MANKKLLRAKIDKLIDIVDRNDELPEEVEGAVNAVLEEIEDDVAWWKKPFFKNGEFSKTATFTTLAYFVTLNWYALSMFAGHEFDLGLTTMVIKSLDPTLVVAVLGIASGTYVGNNIVKKSGVEEKR